MLLQITYPKKNALLIALLISGFTLSQQHVIDYYTEKLPCAKENLHIIKHANTLVITDPGCLGRSLSAVSFVQYTLIPHIIQTFGTHTIDHLILLKPGKLTFDAVLALMERTKIKHIYIPIWQGSLSKSGLYAFMRIKEKATLAGTALHRLSREDLTIVHDAKATIHIKNLQSQLQKGPIQFNAFCICHTIDKQSVTLYPSQYKPSNI